MAEKKYSAFAIDLDGTLVCRDERVSPRVAQAVRRIAGSIPVSIVSGRETSDVLRFAGELGLTAPQVTDNGAMIVDPDSGRLLHLSPLGVDNARIVLTELVDRGLTFVATDAERSVTDPAGIGHWEFTRVSALDLDEAVADELVDRFQDHAALHSVKATLPYNGLWAVDFTHAGVDKASAVRRLAGLLGTDVSRMVAAGDSHNDIPLLETCGLRIAMGDAPDELKALADYVAPSVDDDGLAVAIDEFVIPRL